MQKKGVLGHQLVRAPLHLATRNPWQSGHAATFNVLVLDCQGWRGIDFKQPRNKGIINKEVQAKQFVGVSLMVAGCCGL
eukprot:1138084-Pelagomonas_calceolata.AAC.2